MNLNIPSDPITIGDATVTPSENTACEVKLYGLYRKNNTVTIPFPWTEDEILNEREDFLMRVVAEETDNLSMEKIIDVDIIDPDTDGYHGKVNVTRTKFFCISNTVTINRTTDTLPTVNEEYFNKMLTDHNIDPSDVIEIQTCNIETKTQFKHDA